MENKESKKSLLDLMSQGIDTDHEFEIVKGTGPTSLGNEISMEPKASESSDTEKGKG